MSKVDIGIRSAILIALASGVFSVAALPAAEARLLFGSMSRKPAPQMRPHTFHYHHSPQYAPRFNFAPAFPPPARECEDQRRRRCN